MKRVTTCLGFKRQLAASAFAAVSASERISRESKVRMGISCSEHAVGIDGMGRDVLDYVPMLDDLAILAAEDVDGCRYSSALSGFIATSTSRYGVSTLSRLACSA